MRLRRNKDNVQCDGCKLLTGDTACHPVTKCGSYCGQCREELDALVAEGYGGILAAVQYVEVLREAYRTLSPVRQWTAHEIFGMLSPPGRVLAFEILQV